MLKVGHIKEIPVLLRWLAWSLEHQYLFVSVKGSTGVGAASRDIGVGRRFRDLETQPKNYHVSGMQSPFIYEMRGFP